MGQMIYPSRVRVVSYGHTVDPTVEGRSSSPGDPVFEDASSGESRDSVKPSVLSSLCELTQI